MNDSASFIRRTGAETFALDWRLVNPESYFTTARLVREVAALRHHARGTMLDIGCGTKPYEVVFRDVVERHIGADRPVSLHGHKAIDVFSTALALPFEAEAFDFVLCTEVLEHVPDPHIAYAEISRVLKPGAYAIVTTPFMYRVHEAPYDFYRYTRFGHEHLANGAGLVAEGFRTRGGLISVSIDLSVKSLATLISGIGVLFHQLGLMKRPLLNTVPVRMLFYAIQMPLVWLLADERIKSDMYTLGYVILLRKPQAAQP